MSKFTDKPTMSSIIQDISITVSQDELRSVVKEMQLEELLQLKLRLDEDYYNSGDNLVSDFVYDNLVRVIQTHPKYDGNLENDEIGCLPPIKNRVKLPYWMGSVNKAVTQAQLNRFYKRDDLFYDTLVLTAKLDGVSAMWMPGTQNLYTRGNGSVGTDISHHAKYIKGLEKTPSDIRGVRGELVIPINDFKKHFTDIYKNPRNAVSGLISNKKASVELLSYIRFVAFECISSTTYMSPLEQLTRLDSYGFCTVRKNIVKSKAIDISVMSDILDKFRDEAKYEMDGLVVYKNVTMVRYKTGNPRHVIGYKKLGDVASARVAKIDWQTTKHGVLVPVLVFQKAVRLCGVSIRKASAHSAKMVVDRTLGPGAECLVTRANDVLPYVMDVLTPAPDGPSLPASVEYVWSGVNIVRSTPGKEQAIKMISYFFQTVGIKHIGDKTVERMWNAGFRTVEDILLLSKDQLMTVERVGERTAQRMLDEINDLRRVKIPPERLAAALSLFGRGFGERLCYSIMSAIPELLQPDVPIPEISKGKGGDILTQIEGISDKRSNLLTRELLLDAKSRLQPFTDFIGSLQKQTDDSTTQLDAPESKPLQGKRVVVTGSRKLIPVIVSLGGTLSTSVSRKTDLLIYDPDVTTPSTKYKRAIELGIHCMSRTEFETKYVH